MRRREERRPFPIGGPVPPEDLVGRESLISDLFERAFRQKTSLVLSAPRQTGKTSIVLELLRRVRQADGRGVYIDCSPVLDVRDLAQRVAAATYNEARSRGAFARLAEVLKAARPIVYHADTELALLFFSPRPESDSALLDKALGLADELAAKDRKRAVVVYDEFPRLRSVSPKIFDQVRARLQHANTNTAYIFLGSEVGILEELFKKRTRMPFRLAMPMHLPSPDKEEWVEYIERRFRAWDRPLAEGEAERLVELSGGHPRDLMEMCARLLAIRQSGRSNLNDVGVVLDQTLDGLEATFDQIWKSLERPSGTRVTALRIAMGRPAYGEGRPRKTVQRTIEKLESEGLVRRVGRGSYEFTEALFGLYVRRLALSSSRT